MAASLPTDSVRGSPDDVTVDTNMNNRLHDVDVALLAAQLASAIKGDSINDVRAALEQGAPVNYLYKVKQTHVFRGYSFITYEQNPGFQTHPPILYAQIMTSI